MPGIMGKIAVRAIQILRDNPDGVHFAELVRRMEKVCPEFKPGVVYATVVELPHGWSQEVYKPARGLYRHTFFRDKVIQVPAEPQNVAKLPEDAFYLPFANWLVEDVEECTKAVPLGGAKFKDKWGTPDVIGIRKARESDIIKPGTEIVTAEIKTNVLDLITAFGQACAYKLFSHKSYIVIPKDAPEEDRTRIESLCLIFGIGLVLFNNANAAEPGFEIRVRPSKQEPDMFYVNEYLKKVEDDLFK
jgi:hypothetical protein